MNVLGAFDLRHHDHFELVADCGTSVSRSSRTHGESKLLIRVHNWVDPKSVACAIATSPSRAASFLSAGIASSRLPSRTSTLGDVGNLRSHTFVTWVEEVNHSGWPEWNIKERGGCPNS